MGRAGIYLPLTLIRYDSGGGGSSAHRPDRHDNETPVLPHKGAGVFLCALAIGAVGIHRPDILTKYPHCGIHRFRPIQIRNVPNCTEKR